MSRARALAPFAAIVAMIALLLAVRACITVDPLDQLAPVPSEPRDPAGTTAHAGSLDIARGGPVMIGFQSETDARLTVGTTELRGHGLVTPWNAPTGCMGLPPTPRARIVLPAGPIAIRFAAPPGARLVWSPVGRRGDPEYQPASSLSPDPPARATFDPGAGAAVSDGLLALAILALVVAFFLQLAHARLAGVPREVWLAMAGVLGVALVARWLCPSFGATWDEDVNWASGRNYISNLLALDFRTADWQWNCEHPPVMKYLDGIGAQLADGYGPARALSAVWISLGCALLVPIGRRLFSLRAGIAAGAIAALLPPLVAHGQIVGHESPTILWWALGILLALTAHDDVRDPRTLAIRLAWVGVAIGVATASRFVNGLLGPTCVAIVIARAPAGWRVRTLLWSLVMPLASVVTIYALWPRLWTQPVFALAQSFAKLNVPHSSEPFLGEVSSHFGPSYFPAYLLATLPIGVLAGVVIGAIRGARERSSSWLVALAWLVLGLGVMLSPVKQDGVRYVMPCVLALAIIAGAGVDQLATWLRHRFAYAAVMAVLVAYLAIVDVRTHPYYLDYFGEQVGGADNVAANNWFETAWWGEGLDRALDYVDEHAPPGAKVYRCIEPAHLAWLREDLWTPVDRPDDASYIVWYAPRTWHCALPKGAHRVYQVENHGLVLAEVWVK